MLFYALGPSIVSLYSTPAEDRNVFPEWYFDDIYQFFQILFLTGDYYQSTLNHFQLWALINNYSIINHHFSTKFHYFTTSACCASSLQTGAEGSQRGSWSSLGKVTVRCGPFVDYCPENQRFSTQRTASLPLGIYVWIVGHFHCEKGKNLNYWSKKVIDDKKWDGQQ